MTITDVRIRKIAAEGQNGLFIAMPSRKTPDGEFKDIAHPINTDTREKIQTSILKAYEEAMEEENVVISE